MIFGFGKNPRATSPSGSPSTDSSTSVHALNPADISPEVAEVRALMIERFGDQVDRLSEDDWCRWGYVLNLVRDARSLLDVGTGPGAFINSVARSGFAEPLVGIDTVANYTLFSQLFPNFSKQHLDAESMNFPNNAFDTVTCMEVIEHLPDGKMERVISQLRRVASRRLVVTVPFCEPLPLSRWHLQRFDIDRVRAIFPQAKLTVLQRSRAKRTPWLLIDEVTSSP